jgi:hypothetical protein
MDLLLILVALAALPLTSRMARAMLTLMAELVSVFFLIVVAIVILLALAAHSHPV